MHYGLEKVVIDVDAKTLIIVSISQKRPEYLIFSKYLYENTRYDSQGFSFKTDLNATQVNTGCCFLGPRQCGKTTLANAFLVI